MIHNLVRITQLYIIVFYIEIITCDIDYFFDGTFDIQNTDLTTSIPLSAAFDPGEVDNASVDWADSSRSPRLDHFYNIAKSIQERIVIITLEWNTDRTVMEREDGGGTLLFTVFKNSLTVGNNTLEIVVHWKPGNASVSRNPASGNILRDSKLIMTCSGDKGYPIGNVTWKFNGADTTDSVYNTDVITIDEVQAEHDGDWSCYFTNGLGSGNESEIQTVEVKWEPGVCDLVLNPNTDYITCGSKVVLTCTCRDKGRPVGELYWVFNGTRKNGTVYPSDIVNLNPVKSSDAGEWGCYYKNNLIVETPPHSSKTIRVKLTPLPPKIELDVKTALTLTISITSGVSTCAGNNNSTNITLSGYNESLSIIKPFDISNYVFQNLQPDTAYNISVFYNNTVGDGEPAFRVYSTKPLPVSEIPIIKRHWLAALVEMTIDNPNSTSGIEITVCSIDKPVAGNCTTETITDIETDFRKGTSGSFSSRLVNVSIYDNGVQVYAYSDEIGPAVLVISLIVLAGVLFVVGILVIIIVVIKKKKKNDTNKPREVAEEEISPYTYSNPAMATNRQSRTGTGPSKALNEYSPESTPRKLPQLDNADQQNIPRRLPKLEQSAPPIYSVVNKGKPLAPIAASPATGPVYSQVDWSKKNSRQSLKGLPMSKKAIDKITFSNRDGSIHMHLEVSKKLTGEIEIDVCREGAQSSKSKVPKQHFGGTKNVVMVLPIKETSEDRYTINMKFIVKGQMVQEVDLTYPYETNSVNVTVLNDAYVTSGTGPEMPTYSEVNKPKKKKKAAEEQPYEDVETKKQSSHNDRSTNSVSPSNAEVAVEGVPPHPPRKGAPKEGVMYAELDLNSSGAPRLLPRLGSKSPAKEPVIYADVRPGQNDVV